MFLISSLYSLLLSYLPGSLVTQLTQNHYSKNLAQLSSCRFITRVLNSLFSLYCYFYYESSVRNYNVIVRFYVQPLLRLRSGNWFSYRHELFYLSFDSICLVSLRATKFRSWYFIIILVSSERLQTSLYFLLHIISTLFNFVLFCKFTINLLKTEPFLYKN